MGNEIVIHSKQDLKSKIYTIRGVQVMLDFDLAEIYGYSTKRFNEQVKNNIEKFDEDFRFQLTWDEYRELLNLKECSSKIIPSGVVKEDLNLKSKFSTSSWGGVRKLPYAFTEQGIYMLMTVLRGDMAIQQSKMLIRLFKGMKDFILEREHLIGYDEVAKLAIQTSQNTKDIALIGQNLSEIKADLSSAKADIAHIIEDFTNPEMKKDFLFLNGKPVEADLAYQEIYAKAKKTIFVIDNYIDLKTLVLLKSARKNVKITIFTDNKGKGLHQKEFDDFSKEYPNITVTFKMANGIFHDRYIVLDFDTENETIYHCGASSKDAGKKVSAITTIADIAVYKPLIKNILKNQDVIF
ncbi:ORF6N domain-containing protein [bacterium]|nr:ORF6N domain-containing protein [bacterium]